MGMATAQKLSTVKEIRALPDDGRRYELIDGRLLVNGVLVPDNDLESFDDSVSPGPSWTHQRAMLALARLLASYVEAQKIGELLIAPADVEYEDSTTVQPDLFVVPLVSGRIPDTWEEVGHLLLAIEVLSPTSGRVDRLVKRRLYQRQRAPEYWVVDVDSRLVERWRPVDDRPEVLSERIEWRPDPAQPPLSIDLVAYFAGVIGE